MTGKEAAAIHAQIREMENILFGLTQLVGRLTETRPKKKRKKKT